MIVTGHVVVKEPQFELRITGNKADIALLRKLFGQMSTYDWQRLTDISDKRASQFSRDIYEKVKSAVEGMMEIK